MKNSGWFSRLSNQQPSSAKIRRMSACIGSLLLVRRAWRPRKMRYRCPSTPNVGVPTGYSAHSSVDVGGRIAGLSGSGAMYDTMVNVQSGPRMLGQTFETARTAWATSIPLFDSLMRVFTTGFGGDPNNFAKMDFSKGKYYEFSGFSVATASTSITIFWAMQTFPVGSRCPSGRRHHRPAPLPTLSTCIRHSCLIPFGA